MLWLDKGLIIILFTEPALNQNLVAITKPLKAFYLASGSCIPNIKIYIKLFETSRGIIK